MIDNRLQPLKVEWLLTRRCNLRCSYCKIRYSKTLLGKELSFEEVMCGVKYINERFPRVPIIFFGGEPTLFDWLPDLVEFCQGSSIKYAIISNSIRAIEDEEYFQRLIDAGISNWSVSIDAIEEFLGDSGVKSMSGLEALKKFKRYGVKDLTACITVSKANIRQVPKIIHTLSKLGVWSITTPLILEKEGFEYSQGKKSEQCVDEIVIDSISRELGLMASLKKYQMHNSEEYYKYWNRYFISQDWKCSKKYSLTIDADGSLKRCVDKKAGLERFSILDLKDRESEYCDAVEASFECGGCFWDPAFETWLRGENWDYEEAINSFRHE